VARHFVFACEKSAEWKFLSTKLQEKGNGVVSKDREEVTSDV
jgi:hypothetical protein